jgi:hypothetical protein
MTFRFVSNVDGTDFAEATRDLDPAETLFIVSSKTFTTLETMTNAHARATGARALGDEAAVARHFVAVSTNAEKVAAFGIDTANMFGFWDWVGGRYSMDSAIGLSTMIAIGPDALPRAARRLPRDGRALPHRAVRANLPVLMGCSASGTRDFFGAQTVAVLPYDQYLKRFPRTCSSSTMESNGKHVTLDGAQPSTTQTGPIVLGRARHQRPARFYQLIHQGTRLIPCDFIGFGQSAEPARPAPRPADGQRVRADRGARVRQDGGGGARRGHAPTRLVPHRVFEGNRPSTRSSPSADAARARRAGRAVRAQRVHAGRDLGHRLVRPVGRRAGQGLAQQEIDAETTPLRDPWAYQYDIDVAEVAEVWRRGSVVGSWLVDLTAGALAKSPQLDEFAGRVSDSGEGRWTVLAAIDEGVPASVITAALYERFESRGNGMFTDKLMSAMRNEFGGHDEKPTA